MLDKIAQVSSNLKLKNNVYSGIGKKFKGLSHDDFLSHDSIFFSPAVNFMSRIYWQLKEINLNGKEKIALVFIASGFEFHTELDFLSFLSMSRQQYDISMDTTDRGKNERIMLTVSAKKQTPYLNNELNPLELTSLGILFGRIIEFGTAGEMNKSDNIFLISLLDEINDNIIKEFEYINVGFFSLVDKLVPGSIPQKVIFPEDYKEPVIIEKIKVLLNDK
ncbi:MAG: hypothetical protein WCJ01_07365 [Ignavibacteria bacterium]